MNLTQDNVIAYFQPILSADTREIYAYEVLGRFIDDDGNVKSLGTFFNSPDTSHEEALRVDRIVRRYAIKKYAQEKRSEYLFINIRLAWLLPFAFNPEEMVTLQTAKEFGVDNEKLVIEITEEDFNSSEEYIRAIVHYKRAGCRIALDDYGKEASNIDRLAKLQPDIIKINIDYIHNSEKSYHYREYLRAIASFADSVGIEVLYEGVETERQLDICISSKGRFYQGFLIAVPQPSMIDTVINTFVFLALIETAYKEIQDKAVRAESLRNCLDIKIESFLLENPFIFEKTNSSAYLMELFNELHSPDRCKPSWNVVRIYLCSRQGIQLSGNIERILDNEKDDVQNQRNSGVKFPNSSIMRCGYKNKNWAWRGFFQETITAFAVGKKSFLSNAYRDFTTKERIFTYCYAINEEIFLFADIIKDAEVNYAVG